MIDQSWKDYSKWQQYPLKIQGKSAMMRNYSTTVLVSVIYVLFGIGYGSSTINVASNPQSGRSGQLFLDALSYDQVYQNIFQSDGFVLYKLWNQLLSYSSPITDALRHLSGAFTGGTASASFFSLLSFVLVMVFTLLFKNIVIVGDRRYFLENRLYGKTQLSRVLYVYKQRKVVNVAWVMLVKGIFQILWSLTVIGGIVKFYSYRLVPFILAENPSMKALPAITLSRAMMDGNKWRWFLMDLSFLPWHFLSGITFQIAGLLYVYGYVRSTQANLYADLRSKALSYQMIGASMLHDDRLYEANQSAAEYYPDYEKNMERQRVLEYFGRHYAFLHMIFLFFAFALFGWLWEVSLYLIRDGVFVNRGYLHGPWLPIYGFGGILILLVLKKVRHNVSLTFGSTILLCGLLEYSTSWYMEATLGKRWWDYSNYLFNINGRVCLEALLLFAVGGCTLVYLIAPSVDNLLQKISARKKILLAVILIILFCSDALYTHFYPNEGQGITSGLQTTVSAAASATATTSASCGGIRG